MPTSNIRYLLFLCAVILVLQAVATLSSFTLSAQQGAFHWGLAIEPRTLSGLVGLFTAPFVHGSMSHAVSNVIALFLLGATMAITAPRIMWRVTLFVVIVGGLGVWVFGRDSLHGGASGLVFGWMGFLVLRGVFDRNLVSLLVSMGVAAYFGGAMVGIFNVDDSVSWEAHLFSLLAGFAAAYVFRRGGGATDQPTTQEIGGS